MHMTDFQKQVMFRPIRIAVAGWQFADLIGTQSRIQRAEAIIRAFHPLVQPHAEPLLMPLRARVYNLKADIAPRVKKITPMPEAQLADERNLSKRRA